MIGDAYRALELLATHPRIDPARIVVMGFSKGGAVALYSALMRFQRLHGPAGGARFASHIAFYPPCYYSFVDELLVSDRPVRIFQGTADDLAPIELCRGYVERLRRTGPTRRSPPTPGLTTGSIVQATRPRVPIPASRMPAAASGRSVR